MSTMLRTINSIIEFKQIIGRGTRLYEGKAYFTIYDFVKAYQHFNDPEWDGEPIAPERPRGPEDSGPGPDGPDGPDGPGVDPPPPPPPREKRKVKLADGKERTIQSMVATSFWSPDGKPMSAAEFVQRLFGHIPELFQNEDELRRLWSRPDTRRQLLEGLAERGYGVEQLREIAGLINAEKSDIFDVLAYIAYADEPITREERVATRRNFILGQYDPNQQDFLDFVLGQYVEQGVSELDLEKLPDLLELKYNGVSDAVAQLGRTDEIRAVFSGFQAHLYARDDSA
jgi:type I restriction enzyme R subunit